MLVGLLARAAKIVLQSAVSWLTVPHDAAGGTADASTYMALRRADLVWGGDFEARPPSYTHGHARRAFDSERACLVSRRSALLSISDYCREELPVVRNLTRHRARNVNDDFLSGS